MLTKCPSCGNKISANATSCPHCKCIIENFRKPEMRPCRSCGSSLAVKEHYVTIYKSDPTILDRSPVSEHTKHTPCPKCGDPRPLEGSTAKSSSPMKMIAAAILLLAIAGATYFAWLKYGGH